MNSLLIIWESKLRFLNNKRFLSNVNKIYKIKNNLFLKKNEKSYFKKGAYKYIETSTTTTNTNTTNKIADEKIKKVCVSALLIGGGLFSYQFYYRWNDKKRENDFLSDMREISDSIFDNTDNIILFVINKNKNNEREKKFIEIKEEVNKLGLTNITYLYTYDDKDLPDYSCFLYKGRRRMMLTDEDLRKETRIETFRDFFKPISENYEILNEGQTEDFPTFVTHDSFHTEVIEDSMKNKILLVLFENTCFLCFLYKPFINSLNKLFKENNMKLKIKKYNIEKNDYAPNMIVCRGTPTFLYYHEGKGIKLSEYKPSEIINKITEITDASIEIKDKMLLMSEQIHARMHYFGHLVLWMTESRILETMILKKHIGDKSEKIDEENVYTDMMSSLIEEDMLRNDMLEDSLEYTKGRIKEAEKNCYVVALMMGQELVDEENKK